MKYMEKLDPPLQPSTSVAEREKRDRDKRARGEETDEEEDLGEGDSAPPSDSLIDAFGF